jgi:alkaline phosphatase D
MSRDPWSNANKFLQHRRDFLSAGASLAVLPWVAQVASGIPQTRFAWSKDPFQLGVASGDPTSDSVVLWTRLAPEPVTGEGLPDSSIEVIWELSPDESMQQIIRTGKTLASPALNHSVHVEVDGLSPDRWYYYRFHAGDATSPVGRTRTMPPAGEIPDRLRFAFASCQHYEAGLYTAYEHMVRDELDLVLHLGDYIYEGPAGRNKLRQHNSPEIVSLQDYRNRYGLYKSDQHLIKAHQHAPWIVVWDDHEFDNNYANLISEELHVDPREFMLRRVNAYQAYYENMPLRSSTIPKGPDMLLYRSISFGQLANFAMLDTRQYRSDQPNGDGRKPLEGQVFHPKATLLGEQQEEWLMTNLRKSDSRWNILGQQVMVARVDRVPGEVREYSMDQWSGYDIARKRLLREISELERANTVVLTGDIHTNWANELKVDFDDFDSPPVATEFVGTSISSGGNGYDQPKELNALLSENPFVKYHNGERGYVRCEVTATHWKTDYQTVPFVDKPGAPIQTRASFVVEHNRPKLERA